MDWSVFCFSSCSFLSTGALTSLSTPISPSPVCFLFTRQQRHRTYHAFSLFLPTAEMRDLKSTQKLYLCLTSNPHPPPPSSSALLLWSPPPPPLLLLLIPLTAAWAKRRTLGPDAVHYSAGCIPNFSQQSEYSILILLFGHRLVGFKVMLHSVPCEVQ